MSGQLITLRGTRADCWFVDRLVSDEPQSFTQSLATFEEEWFDLVAAHGGVEYSEMAVCPKVLYQFVLRRAPIVC